MFRDKVNSIISDSNTDVLRKAQLTMLEIMLVIDGICREHNITYWIDSGTLLGAIRHKGFIPWDDDCDICMPRKDYEKFISIVKDNLPSGITYENKETKNWSQKHADLNQTFIKLYYLDHFKGQDRSFNQSCRGVFVDIFPFDSVVPKMCYSKSARFLNEASNLRNPNPKTARARIKTILQDMKIENLWINKCKNLDKSGKATHMIYGIETPFMKEKYLKTCLHKKENIFPLTEVEFEGHMLYAPNNPHNYLTNLYGDYMEIPAESEREPHIMNLTL